MKYAYAFLLSLILSLSLRGMGQVERYIEQKSFIENLLVTKQDINISRPELNYWVPLEWVTAYDSNLLEGLLNAGAQISSNAFCKAVKHKGNFHTLWQHALKQAKASKIDITSLINEKNQYPETTPFLAACTSDEYNDVVKEMIARGADLTYRNQHKETCLLVTLKNGAFRNINTLLPFIKQRCSALMNAQDIDNPPILQGAVAEWASKDDKNNREKCYALAALLLSYGADPNTLNKDPFVCRTPLSIPVLIFSIAASDVVVEKECKDHRLYAMICMLLAHGANPALVPEWPTTYAIKDIRKNYEQWQSNKPHIEALEKDPASYIFYLPADLKKMLPPLIADAQIHHVPSDLMALRASLGLKEITSFRDMPSTLYFTDIPHA